MFTLAIPCLTTSNLPWFRASYSRLQYWSSQHQTLLSPLDASTAGQHCHFCPATSFFLVYVCLSRSVVSDSLQPARLLCPWDFPGKNTGVGCHFLLQRIFPTKELNSGLLHSRQIPYTLSHPGSHLILSKAMSNCPLLPQYHMGHFPAWGCLSSCVIYFAFLSVHGIL